MDILFGPWHWAFSGFMIAVVMALLLLTGRRFGVSTSFRTVCSMSGAGRFSDYFKYDWKSQAWLLTFIGGSIIGGYLGGQVLGSDASVDLSANTIGVLTDLGINGPSSGDHALSMMPQELFGMAAFQNIEVVILWIIGGLLIGFGTRWAGGCTSGHAISGLSNLQLPSLVAVIGFFIGGLTMTHLIYPIIFSN